VFALAKGARLLKASGLANPYMLAKNFTEVRTAGLPLVLSSVVFMVGTFND
jgi:hypothetical protein